MEFSPTNKIVKLCLQGMTQEDSGQPQAAAKIFLQAFNEAENDFEKFLAAHYVARHQQTAADKLKWLETTLQFALKSDEDAVKSAFPELYTNLAKNYEALGDVENAKKYTELAASFNAEPTDKGPFYHGTKADLPTGELLTPGGNSNYQAELKMNHIYFTALPHGAGLAAALAQGNGPDRVYMVEPTGSFENDPNVTNKKFPGNPTRSYRSAAPLKIIGEVSNWSKLTPQELQNFREKVANSQGEIIN